MSADQSLITFFRKTANQLHIPLLVVIFCAESNHASDHTTALKPADEPIRFMERVNFHGYIAEEHIVQSDDGYDLVLHRISGSPANPPAPGKKVVYVQHGFLMSTDMFVVNGPEIDFVYLLVDAGYDVWLGNIRGNVYSQSHKSLIPADKEFWDFSYHEPSIYDVKAFIDYSLKVTKQKKCVFIGYSLGTAYGFALFSSRPEYNDKVALIINIGTIVTWHHNKNLIVNSYATAAKYDEKWNGILKSLLSHGSQPRSWMYEFSIQLKRIGPLTSDLCESNNFFAKIICKMVFKTILPRLQYDHVPEGSLSRMLSTFPAGTSSMTMFHVAQNIRSGNFAQYDYGKKINQEKYGNNTPPNYPLDQITAPVAIYYGLNDFFSNPEDLKEMKAMLPNVIVFKEINDKYFGHFDVMLNKDAKNVLFNDFITLINSLTW